MKLCRVVCLLAIAGMVCAGCGERKEAKQSPGAAKPLSGAPAISGTSTNPPEIPGVPRPAYPQKTDAERLAMREKHRQMIEEQFDKTIQETVTNLAAVTQQAYEIEAAARTNNPGIQAAYDAMTRARDAYESQVAALPALQPLRARQEELKETYGKLTERKQAVEKEMKTP